jgi:hypothetical protein
MLTLSSSQRIIPNVIIQSHYNTNVKENVVISPDDNNQMFRKMLSSSQVTPMLRRMLLSELITPKKENVIFQPDDNINVIFQPDDNIDIIILLDDEFSIWMIILIFLKTSCASLSPKLLFHKRLVLQLFC